MFVVFTNTEEVLVTTKSQEKKMRKLYFTEGSRDINDYDRTESNDPGVCITAKLRVE